MYCTGCGREIDPVDPKDDRLDSQYCTGCNDRFYAAMAEEYPYGQCQDCGAEGRPLTCENGVEHIVEFHIEGACRRWRDYGDAEGCAYGCPAPAVEPATRPSTDHSDDFPF